MFGRKSEEPVLLFSAFISRCLETSADIWGFCLFRTCWGACISPARISGLWGLVVDTQYMGWVCSRLVPWLKPIPVLRTSASLVWWKTRSGVPPARNAVGIQLGCENHSWACIAKYCQPDATIFKKGRNSKLTPVSLLERIYNSNANSCS